MGHSHDTGHVVLLHTMLLLTEIAHQVAPVLVILKNAGKSTLEKIRENVFEKWRENLKCKQWEQDVENSQK